MAVDPGGGVWGVVVPLLVVALVAWRALRPRTLRIERMWILPAIMLFGVGLALRAQGLPSAPLLGAEGLALAIGAAAGWWRGRTTTISVDPATHEVTSKASPVGLALIAGLLLVRFGLRGYASDHAAALHVTPMQVADVFLLFAIGLVCAQRAEMWLRARNLLRAARALSAEAATGSAKKKL